MVETFDLAEGAHAQRLAQAVHANAQHAAFVRHLPRRVAVVSNQIFFSLMMRAWHWFLLMMMN
jgi:hypothetical protein